jgi:hypothetical protein
MRREHARCGRPPHHAHVVGKREERVGVDHGRHREDRERARGEARRCRGGVPHRAREAPRRRTPPARGGVAARGTPPCPRAFREFPPSSRACDRRRTRRARLRERRASRVRRRRPTRPDSRSAARRTSPATRRSPGRDRPTTCRRRARGAEAEESTSCVHHLDASDHCAARVRHGRRHEARQRFGRRAASGAA